MIVTFDCACKEQLKIKNKNNENKERGEVMILIL